MIIVRPICKNDIDAYTQLSYTAGIGMSSMPKHKDALEKKIIDSENAFAKDAKYPENENYIFILENLITNQIEGTCGINAKTGVDQPKYFYNIQIDKKSGLPLLRATSHHGAPSEICSLYLLPEFRKEGQGRLLSLSRFLFAASHPHRFDKIIYAEMRGFIDNNQFCPFWEGIGRHFVNLDYPSVMRFRDLDNFDVTQVLPKHPIYIPLLPLEIQNVIRKIHNNTLPAYHMLKKEGFHLTADIDVFDGGPKIEAKTKEIHTIKKSLIASILEITEHPIESPSYIISNLHLDFRSCYSMLKIDKKGISIPLETAKALNVSIGDLVRYI